MSSVKLCTWLLLACLTVSVTVSQSTLTELSESGGSLAPSIGNSYDENYEDEEELEELDDSKNAESGGVAKRTTLAFVKELKNVTKEAGDFLKLRCDVTGSIPANSIQVRKDTSSLGCCLGICDIGRSF